MIWVIKLIVVGCLCVMDSREIHTMSSKTISLISLKMAHELEATLLGEKLDQL